MTEQAGYTRCAIDDMESVWRGSFKRARGELGIEAFGLGVMDLPPNIDWLPRHVHTFDGQEEVYIPLRGRGWIDIGEDRVPLEPGVAVKVDPPASRTLLSGPDGLRVLIAGGIPGKPYETFGLQDKGAPEPNPKDLPGIKAAEGQDLVGGYVAVPVEGSGPMSGYFDGVTIYPLRKALGLTAFGLSEVQIDPPTEGESEYPNHDHAEDGHEEVYVVASGSGALELDGERVPMSEGDAIRIDPPVARKWIPDAGGIRVIAMSSKPGAVYELGTGTPR
jgi:hypothetical protein